MIGIVNYQANNLRSVANAFRAIGAPIFIADQPESLQQATAIVLPGVGAFSDSMHSLNRLGFIEPLQYAAQEQKKPILGLCLGMQLLAEKSYEFGEHIGLGWLPGVVEKIEPASPAFRVPHMGWNNLEDIAPQSMLLKGIVQPAVVYFVHSYYVESGSETIATTNYILPFSSALQKNNFYAVQFHPEKSAAAGQQILKNFLKL